MDTREVIARFEAERQALAMMDHPNIAKVLDAGQSPPVATGGLPIPYFVMELVRGVPISEYCDQARLTPRQRIELFVPVCQAIQHAHQKGIIHRDIKPSNILVTIYDGKPVPKVIDFGIAKAIGSKLTETTVYTRFTQLVGSPLYMSPEQVELTANDVDTRADVYALGVVLYELLTGNTPFDSETIKSVGFDELRRIIREDDPPKPSQRVSTLAAEKQSTVSLQRGVDGRRLSQMLRGELDWIVMKTLEKDRNRRYESASAFAADVQRYLNDEPVHACPPSAWYRFRKFARRNKRALATATFLGVMLLAAVGAVAWTIGWAARDRAVRQARLASQVELILLEAERRQHEQLWPEALAAAQRAEVLTAGAEDAELGLRVQNLLADLRLVQRLEAIRLQVSELKDDGFDNEAGDRAYASIFREQGIDIEKLPVQETAEWIRSRPGIAHALTATLDHWAACRSRAKGWAGIVALTMAAQAADPDPLRQKARTALFQQDWKALEELAKSNEMLRLPPTTLILLSWALHVGGQSESSLEVLRKGQREYPADFWINFNLAHSSANAKPPRLDEAISFYRAALAVRPNNAAVYNNLGNAFANKGDLDEAIACYRKAIHHLPENTIANYNLGVRLQKKGQAKEAIAAYREAIRIRPKYSAAYQNLGALLQAMGETDEAIACERKAVQLEPDSAASHYNLAITLKAKGELDEAISCFRKALELQPDFAACLNNLGVALEVKNELDEAIACYRKAIHIKPDLVSAHNNLGAALKDKGELGEAIACYREALRLKPDSAKARNSLPVALNGLARGLAVPPDAKSADIQQAVALAKEAVEHAPKAGNYWNTLGVAHYRARDWSAAVVALEKSGELRKGGDSNDWFFLAMAHWQLDEKGEARKWYDRATEWLEKNRPNDVELRRFRDEAAKLLKIDMSRD